MTALEDRLYLALLGARTIVSATVNVNPRAGRILDLINSAAEAYKAEKAQSEPPATEAPEPETAHAD